MSFKQFYDLIYVISVIIATALYVIIYIDLSKRQRLKNKRMGLFEMKYRESTNHESPLIDHSQNYVEHSFYLRRNNFNSYQQKSSNNLLNFGKKIFLLKPKFNFFSN